MNYSHRCIPGLFWLLAVTAFLLSFTPTSRAAEANTLVIVSHPYPEQSVMTKGLEEAARSVPGVTVRNLEALYGFDSRNINADEERRLMREHARVVFIFPTHWFNITPMMKAWLNATWGSVGPGIWQGKEMMIVTTAAGGESTYGESGRIGVSLADVFTPMKASALHAGMTWLPPLVFENASRRRLPEYQRQLVERLTN
ncbi:NAD(P)H-dependent oxidoreductase [Klebsiella grimontii]|uniref:NAD(P)H-dependent oxidoreductase n=1 Tax=Klebsiella grimontii TaxID=2058152 RepID=UPI000E351B65|nr:NAD(P)H-dependent oxidoreductase [Klebsiella grimontii]RFP50444.1 flavodoxin family protein [Klebsiella oxytoca]MBZ6975010.1 NAD(P)H-dependent oxidoreductase [Klebsiella grimontii]MBZ7823025.1 NAD(P)H-dependent oxidoreductase [Klebsiella grimontii]MDK7029762.1 NAD(P)H-dependent oxidoreductase [Klebsiella grimontii]MDM4401717.1 NAD(P)H-dependent oxidoreductase [Klebsiella grimontii]